MDYPALATQLLDSMQALHKFKPQKHLNEAMQGEAFVLRYITMQNGDVLPGEISSEMGVSSARIAVALNSLEGKGLLTRQIDLNDRRKILVSITQDGRALAEKQERAVVENIANMLALLGEEDAKEYIRLMSKLVTIMSANH